MSSKGAKRPDNTGRSGTQIAKHKTGRLESPFVPRTKTMLSSPAWRMLNLADRRVLNRLEIEHMAHAGTENGKLKCTYNDFEKYGVRRKSIAGSIARLEALGFIEVMQRGRKAAGGYHYPSQYRLTHVQGNIPATNEWETVKDKDDADRRIKAAKMKLDRQRTRRMKKFPSGDLPPKPRALAPPTESNPRGSTATPVPGAQTPPLSISRQGSDTAQSLSATGQRKSKAQGRSGAEMDQSQEHNNNWKSVRNILTGSIAKKID